MDGADDGWSGVAAGWAELWGSFAAPAQREIIRAAGIGAGARVLDTGCGSGEFLDMLARHGAVAVGADPAVAMVELARRTGAEVVRAGIEDLPFTDASFDVATAVNALHLAEDTAAALRELARVVVPGGLIAIASWAEGSHNDLDTIERAVAAAIDDDPPADGPLRGQGGIEAALTAAGLTPVASGLVDAPWWVPDEQALVRGILLGEDHSTVAELHPVIVAAAAPFRRPRGGYVLHNALRWGLGRTAPAATIEPS